MNKIDINKKYQTREGNEAHIFYITTDDVLYQVSGQIKVDGEWEAESWNIYGSYHDGEEHPFDLVEVVVKATTDFDPTQNRIPFGLLTEEEQEILRNWPHGVEFYIGCDEWNEIRNPSYSIGITYRAKLLPERIVSWHNVYEGGFGGPYDSREKADYMDISSELRTCVYRIERDADGSNPEIFVEDV